MELVVLDSSDPDYVRAALPDSSTAPSSSSRASPAPRSRPTAAAGLRGAFTDAGIDPTERIVIVTDPGSPLDGSAREAGYRVVNADPDVGGRYSALTAFGLVPSGLAGVDIEALLDDAESVADLLAADDDANPALRLGAAIGGTNPLRDKLAIVDDGSGIVGFADWAEQLIAESTGKERHRHTPVVVEADDATRVVAGPDDVTVVRLVSVDADDEPVGRHRRRRGRPHALRGRGQRLARRADAALGGRHRRGRPAARHQPVRPARRRERQGRGPRAARQGASARRRLRPLTDGAIEIRTMGGDGDWLGGATTVAGALDALFAQLDPNQGYVAVMAYLDRLADAPLAAARRAIALRTGAPDDVRLGSAVPALHRPVPQGRPAVGVYLQITTAAPGGPRHPRPGLHLRRLHRGPGRR